MSGTVQAPEFRPVPGEDPRKDPVRLLLVQGEARPAVDVTDEPMAMTMPHLLVREMIAFLALSIVLVVVSLLFDAPLEEIANPDKTPNPAKAPWYFLGLQELLHYYPPLVSGVLLPGMVVTALAVVPYFEINLKREALWPRPGAGLLAAIWGVVAVLTGVLLFTGAHPIWPCIVPLWMVGLAMSLPAAFPGSSRVEHWLGERSLAFWIFLWFLLCAVSLTLIGVFFRGPGWAFVLPWDGGGVP